VNGLLNLTDVMSTKFPLSLGHIFEAIGNNPIGPLVFIRLGSNQDSQRTFANVVLPTFRMPSRFRNGCLEIVLTPGRARWDERREMTEIDPKIYSKVKTVLEAWEAAWNAADMNAMWQLATDDVHWVNVVGQHWRGKADVQRAHQVNFDLLFKNRTCKLEEIESVERLPGNAVVAVVRWAMGGYRRPTGALRPPGKDRMSLVLVPRGDGLAIAHGANVPIDEQAEAHNPIKH
jgi:uncharacterized protein (TIGR02246 family)